MAIFFTLPGFVCKPIAMFWAPLEREHYCDAMFYNHIQIGLHSTSCVFDFILLVFPIYPVFQLPMTAQHRLGVAIMFVLGAGYVF